MGIGQDAVRTEGLLSGRQYGGVGHRVSDQPSLNQKPVLQLLGLPIDRDGMS